MQLQVHMLGSDSILIDNWVKEELNRHFDISSTVAVFIPISESLIWQRNNEKKCNPPIFPS